MHVMSREAPMPIGCNSCHMVLKRAFFFLATCCRKWKDLSIKTNKLFSVLVISSTEIIIQFNFKIRLIIVSEVVDSYLNLTGLISGPFLHLYVEFRFFFLDAQSHCGFIKIQGLYNLIKLYCTLNIL